MKKVKLILIATFFGGIISLETLCSNNTFCESPTSIKNKSPYALELPINIDSIKGCWGYNSETGNSIFCITSKDSLFWVDPSLWCSYSIINDTITMYAGEYEYYKGHIKYRRDTIFLDDGEIFLSYERNR